MLCLALPQLTHAQATMGAPPPDATALVAAPAGAPDAPKIADPNDGTDISVSAGGQIATGNSRLVAGTVNSLVDHRWDQNGLGGSVIGNYGRSAVPGSSMKTTAQNVQLRVRYDRYLIDQASVFLINTIRHDRFQGLDLRYNLDPGFKYLFINDPATQLWGEAGYDFQYDVRRDDSLTIAGPPVVMLKKTQTDHSLRGFAGVKHAFNEQVSISSGIELLQSLVESKRTRVNYDLLLTAGIGAGFSLGTGFSARYDHAPLPGKKSLDTTTTLSIIYSYASKAEEPAPPPAAAAPEAAPAAAPEPAPAAAPGTAPAAAAAAAPAAAPAAASTESAPAPGPTMVGGTSTTTAPGTTSTQPTAADATTTPPAPAAAQPTAPAAATVPLH
jgi:putative salt-induced outer membrane protein